MMPLTRLGWPPIRHHGEIPSESCCAGVSVRGVPITLPWRTLPFLLEQSLLGTQAVFQSHLPVSWPVTGVG